MYGTFFVFIVRFRICGVEEISFERSFVGSGGLRSFGRLALFAKQHQRKKTKSGGGENRGVSPTERRTDGEKRGDANRGDDGE